MINTLTIRNFQSHKETILDLSPGVNVITGPSDSGKSAILRALIWLVENRPSGDSFRSDWGGSTFVELDLGKFTVWRVRNKDQNEYGMWNPDATKGALIFKAVRSEVPEEVQKALRISPISIQQQHDLLYLFTSSPGEVAKHFNTLAHIDSIDSSIKNVQRWLRDLERKVISSEEHIDGLKLQLTQFENIESLEEKVKALERLEKQKAEKSMKAIQLKDYISQYKTVESALKELKPIQKLSKKVDSIAKLMKDRKGLNARANAIDNILSRIKSTRSRTEAIEFKLERLEEEYENNFPDVCPLCERPM